MELTHATPLVSTKRLTSTSPAEQAAKARHYADFVRLTENTPAYNFAHAILEAYVSKNLRRDIGRTKAAVEAARRAISAKDRADKPAIEYGGEVAYRALRWAHKELSR